MRDRVTSSTAAQGLGRRALRWKFAALFVVKSVLTVGAFGLFAYSAGRKTTLEATHTRLISALTQLDTISELGIANQLETLKTAARDPAVIDAIHHPNKPVPTAALSALRKLQVGGANSTSIVELVLPDSKVLYATDAATRPLEGRRAFDFPKAPVIGPMYERNGVQAFDAEISITDAAGATLGGIRLSRSLGSAASRRALSSLLGEEAALLIGNRNGTLWSDAGVVPYPIGSTTPMVYERNGQRWVSASSPVRGTPWLYAVEIPERVALAPATALLVPFIVTGTLIALVSVLIGLRASHRITKPIAELMAATEAISRGERDVRLVATERQDEIGHLARSFASMVMNVRAMRDRLESEIEVRTGELYDAVDGLRKLDEELRQSERFATIGRVSGSIGHELRNPLSVMSTVVFLLESLPEASPKVKDYAALLREQIRLSERIISDLLDRARSGVPLRARADVPALLDELLGRAEIPSTVQIERRYSAPMPEIELDRDHVGQIVWNLITNAVQAMNGTGTLSVGAAINNGQLRIDVRDTGPGVAPADVYRIFEPLYTTKPEGVGLGLSISRAFARSNGGDLYAETSKRGASFVLELPVILPAAAGDEAAPNLDGTAAEPSAGWTKH